MSKSRLICWSVFGVVAFVLVPLFLIVMEIRGWPLPQDYLDLCKAAENGDTDTIRKLVEKGMDPNAAYGSDYAHGGGPYGKRTALHLAAKGQDKCVEMLLKYGANPCKADARHYLPLWYTVDEYYSAVVSSIEQNESDPAGLNTSDMYRKAQERMKRLRTVAKLLIEPTLRCVGVPDL